MRTLHGKFFFFVTVLVLANGTLALLLQTQTLHHYQLAMTQALNEHLAQELGARYFRPVSSDLATAQSEIHRLMAINPDIEIYLLDKDGRIEVSSALPGQLRRESVAVPPLENFIAGNFVFLFSMTILYRSEAHGRLAL
jgi:two-component system, OmpR family, sensor kinase